MKLATKKNNISKDGELVLISQDNQFYCSASDIAANLITALEKWSDVEPKLQKRYQELNQKTFSTIQKLNNIKDFASVLPRTWLFADGSAFIHHKISSHGT